MSTETQTEQDVSAFLRPPQHVAVIMDGNGRWAQERGLPRLAGHRAGTKILRRVVQHFADRGVAYLTLYAFSTENWGRPRREVSGIWRLLAQVLRREVATMHTRGVRFRHIGRIDRLNPKVQQVVQDAIALTQDNSGITLTVALDYGSRPEITRAVQAIVQSGVNPDDITEETVSAALYTAGMPDPDLIIRTGGETRLSNFLLWQSAYAEFYSTERCWPDFDEATIDEALAAYSHRQRRFGRVRPAG